MRRLVPPAGLYATQRPKQLLRGDRDHRPIANVRVEKTLEPRAQNRDGLCIGSEAQCACNYMS
jgi:hypothetical protein